MEDEWTPERRRDIFRWLVKDTYKPFQTADDLGKMYYALITNPSEIFTNGRQQGYVTCLFRTNAYHAWTPEYYSFFDLSDNETTTIITMQNLSNIENYFYPRIQITSTTAMLPEDEIKLHNLSDQQNDFIIKDLL